MSIASSFNCIETFKREIKVIDNAIEKEIKGLNPNAFIILQSIDGIGPVFAGDVYKRQDFCKAEIKAFPGCGIKGSEQRTEPGKE